MKEFIDRGALLGNGFYHEIDNTVYWEEGDIMAIPTADVVEVKHGRCKFCEDIDWLYEVVCYHPNDNGGSTDIPINFCPNCGAKMDGE